MFAVIGRVGGLRALAALLLAMLVLHLFSSSPVFADNDREDSVVQVESQTLQQAMQQTLDGFLSKLANGDKGEALKAAAESIVQQWLANAALARRLTGADNWRELSAEQKQHLADELSRTLTRYLLEASAQYSGQQISLDKIEATAVNRRSVQLTLRGISGFDGIPVSMELISHLGSWRVADFSVGGVSYSGMKRWQYEVLWRTGGFAALLDHIKAKNDLFFAELVPAPTTAPAVGTAAVITSRSSGVSAVKP